MSSIKDSIIFWGPKTEGISSIVVRPRKPFGINKDFPYTFSWGGCNREIFDCNDFEERKGWVFVNAMHFILVYGLDPVEVHNALLEIDEYRDGCSDELLIKFKK